MLRWLWPKSPLEAREKAWVETRMHLLADHFGIERLLKSQLVLPTDEYFPEVSGSQDPSANSEQLLKRVCSYLQIDPGSVQLAKTEAPKAAADGAGCGCSGGQCGSSATVDEPVIFIASAAQQLSRRLLMRSNDFDSDSPEFELLADLAPVFLGFGVFAANTATTRRALPVRLLAYGLALFAWMRDERHLRWTSFLSADAQGTFRSGMRYLHRSNDSLFQHSTIRRRHGAMSVNELTTTLKSGTPSAKIAALWELAEKGPAAADAIPAISDALRVSHADIRADAAITLAAMGEQAADVVPRLTDTLHDGEDRVRASAAAALGRLGLNADLVVPELASTLHAPNAEVVLAAAAALRQYGPSAEIALPDLLKALRAALVGCNDRNALQLTEAIKTIVADPEACILDFFDEHDTDLRHAAVDLLRGQDPE
jgi:hypothetical protein